MKSVEERADELIRAWCSGPADDLRLRLAPDFQYVDGRGARDREDFLRWRAHTGRHENVELVQMLSYYHFGLAAVFDSTDEVTGLRHRSSIHFFFDEELITFVSEVTSPGVVVGPALDGRRRSR